MAEPTKNTDKIIADLRVRVDELEETLRAIQSGDVDALVISTPAGEKVYTLESPDLPYRLFVETMTEGAVTVTGDGTILYCNAAFSAILQAPLEKIIGNSFHMYFLPGQRESGEEILEMARSRVLETEHFLHNDGREIPVHLSMKPLPIAQGTGISIVVTDLTRQKLDQRLIKEGNLATNILEHAGEALVVCGPGMTVLRSNRTADDLFETPMVNANLTGLLSHSNPLAVPESGPEIEWAKTGVVPSMDYLVNAGSGEGIELVIRRTHDKKIVLMRSAVIHDNHDALVGYLFLFIDITGRKQVEDALWQASKKLTLLSSITRHDINNQLMTINGFLELLYKKVPDPDLEDFFNRITRASSRISAMIQFTREYEQIGVHAPGWQETRTLVESAAKQAPLGKVKVKNDLPAGTEVFADPLIVKVFYNLMDNAARYGGKITTIGFSVEERGGNHVIVCEDDGNGVPAEEKEKIFERGFGKNTGLGLALAREILDITGITVRETGGPGKGARFEMVVPEGMWRFSISKER